MRCCVLVLVLVCVCNATWGRRSLEQRAGRALVSRSVERFRTTGDRSECQGLVSKMCKPCESKSKGPEDWCESMLDECAELFCRPMCLRTTWECEVDFSSFVEDKAMQDKYQDAICREFYAEGCKELDCCPDDQRLLDYVENGAYFDQFPDPIMPFQECQNEIDKPESKQEACDMCNQNKPTLTLKGLECDFPPPIGAEEGAFLQIDKRRRVHTGRTLKFPFSVEVQQLRFMSVRNDDFPGIPDYKSLQERCEELKSKVDGKLGGWESKFGEKICDCGGCCDHTKCPFPILEILE